jgi:hypothetical protein
MRWRRAARSSASSIHTLRARKCPRNHIIGDVAAYINLVLSSQRTPPSKSLNRFLPYAYDKRKSALRNERKSSL